MVVKPRFLPAVAAALSLLLVAAVPALGAYTAAQPDPLVKDQLSARPGHRHGGQDGQVRSRGGRRLSQGHPAG